MSRAYSKARDAAQRVVETCDVLSEITESGFDEFLADVRTQWAVEMGLIRIGETVNRIPADVREQFPGQPWRQIVAMRNFAAHQYDDLDPQRVWRTLIRDIPALRAYLVDEMLPQLLNDQGSDK